MRIQASYINDIQKWAYIPMNKICRYRAARRDSSGSCCRARRSCSENPQIKAIGMWQRSNRRTQRCRCRPTSWGLPDPHDCEHKVSRALTLLNTDNWILRGNSLENSCSSYRCSHCRERRCCCQYMPISEIPPNSVVPRCPKDNTLAKANDC
jgi:hypothetical protein